MGHRVHSKLNTCVLLCRANSVWQYWYERVFFRDGRHSPVQRDERALEVMEDFGLRSYGFRSCLCFLIWGGFFFQNVGGHSIVVSRQVLDLLAESPNPGEFLAMGRK